MSNLKGLWGYWNKPNLKPRLDRVEPDEVSNSDAIRFCVCFTVLAIAIFFLGEFVRLII